METIAFSLWGNRISPVFESSSQLHIVGLEYSRIIRQKTVSLHGLSRMSVIEALPQNGVDTLICGAITNVYARMIEAQGIEVIGFISGEFRDVLRAYLSGTITVNFSMPGCARRRRRRRRGNNKI